MPDALTRHVDHAPALVDVDCLACGRVTKIPAKASLRCQRCGAAGARVRLRAASPLYRDRHGQPLRVRNVYADGQELHLWCSHCRPSHQVRFVSVRQIEAQLGCINPTFIEACHRLVCPASGRYGIVGVAAAPVADQQMQLPLFR
jgi:hypothetical protein